VENRLSTVSGNGQSVQYFYDGDGARVKKVENGQTTVYVGAIYEQNLSTGVMRTYYFAGSQRVAVREGATLTFIIDDHPRPRGGKPRQRQCDAQQQRREDRRCRRQVSGAARCGTLPGEMRLITGSVPTDRRYTGQRQHPAADRRGGPRRWQPASAGPIRRPTEVRSGSSCYRGSWILITSKNDIRHSPLDHHMVN